MVFYVEAEADGSEAVEKEGKMDLTGSRNKLKYPYRPELEYDG